MAAVGDELIRALHAEHAAAVWAYVVQLVDGDRARAEDVVQEALLRAWRHPEVLDPRRGSARAWLLTTARRIVIDEWRSGVGRREVVTGEVPEQGWPDRIDESLQSWLVADALEQLSADHRRVIVECFYLGHSVAEAAARIGIPLGTVKSRTHYALRALRLALEERGVTG